MPAAYMHQPALHCNGKLELAVHAVPLIEQQQAQALTTSELHAPPAGRHGVAVADGTARRPSAPRAQTAGRGRPTERRAQSRQHMQVQVQVQVQWREAPSAVLCSALLRILELSGVAG